jgi:hypothetical protein
MNARIEAAAQALATKDRANLSSWHQEEATEALAAADAVMFSDEAIERAAVALNERFRADDKNEFYSIWEDLGEDQRNHWKADVRAVVAALKGDA